MNNIAKLSYEDALEGEAWDAFRDTNMLDRAFENGLPTDAHGALAHCRDVLPELPESPAEVALNALFESLLPRMIEVVVEQGVLEQGT